jgi:hypothetical protein
MCNQEYKGTFCIKESKSSAFRLTSIIHSSCLEDTISVPERPQIVPSIFSEMAEDNFFDLLKYQIQTRIVNNFFKETSLVR